MNQSDNHTELFLSGIITSGSTTVMLPSENTWEQIHNQTFVTTTEPEVNGMMRSVPPPIVENPVPDSILTILFLAGIYACTILYKIRKRKIVSLKK